MIFCEVKEKDQIGGEGKEMTHYSTSEDGGKVLGCPRTICVDQTGLELKEASAPPCLREESF